MRKHGNQLGAAVTFDVQKTDFARVGTDRVRPARRIRSARTLVLVLVTMLMTTIGVAQPAVAAGPLQLSVKVNTPEFYPNQAVVVTGYLNASDGAPLAGQTVYVQKQTGAGWTTIAKTTTVDRGHYRLYVRENDGFTLRTYAKGYGADSEAASATTITTTEISGNQTIARRYATLAPWLKEPTTAVTTGTSYGKTIRWQSFQHGMLVQAYNRTFLVTGALLKGYLKAGGPTGKLGIPTSDADCYITTTKCIQSFRGGAIYYNTTSVTSTKTHVAYGTGVGAEVIAVAKSQVGYREPAWQTNKFTAWNGRKTPWCGVFLSWASAAGKNGDVVPQVDTFAKLVAEVKRRGVTSEPRVGALAFMNFNGSDSATHVGIITKVNANGSVQTIEGNTVIGSDPKRVVAAKTRTPQQTLYFYLPGA